MPKLRSRAVAAASTASITFTPSWDQSGLPAGHGTDVGVATPQPGDLILAIERVRVGSAPTLTPPAAFAWTQDGPTYGGAVKQFVFHHVVQAGEDWTAAQTWGSSAGSANIVSLLCLTGVDTSTPFVAALVAGNGQGGTTPPITSPAGVTTNDTALHIHSAILAGGTTAHTGSWDVGTTLGVFGNGSTWASAMINDPTTGQTTTIARTLTTSPSDATAWNALVLSIKAAPASAPTVTSAAVLDNTQPHNPPQTGDQVAITSTTVYGGTAATSYERTWQRSTDGGTTWTDIAGSNGTAATQAALPGYTLTTSDVGNRVRMASRASNGAGTSAWSYSNAITPAAATSPPATDYCVAVLAQSGRAGVIGARLYNLQTGAPVGPRSTSGIIELAGGAYRVAVTRPVPGTYAVVVDDGSITPTHLVAIPYVVPS